MGRVRANLRNMGMGRPGVGVLVIVVGLVVAIGIGAILGQPTASVGAGIGWLVATLYWGLGAPDPDEVDGSDEQ